MKSFQCILRMISVAIISAGLTIIALVGCQSSISKTEVTTQEIDPLINDSAPFPFNNLKEATLMLTILDNSLYMFDHNYYQTS
ncbi:MAG: hypothetical protein SCM11_09945 [Bacillota bacterium]|nr:hypothetical protein [Bacillota bacterium]